MGKKLEPASLMLVGATFICISILIGAANGAGQAALPDLQSKLKESTSLHLILSEKMSRPAIVPQTPPSKQSIHLSSADPSCQVSGLTAINSAAERDIVLDETQNGDPKAGGLVNSLGMSVTGDKAEMDDTWSEEDLGWNANAGEDVETIVDNAINSSRLGNEDLMSISAQRSLSAQKVQPGNSLDIDVKGISVTALNTAEGGTAKATSNIIIKPVQIIICPSEVKEKLK